MADRRLYEPYLVLLDDPALGPTWFIVDHGIKHTLAEAKDDEAGATARLLDHARERKRKRPDWKVRIFRTPAFLTLYIYFISSDDVPDYPIKIGYARDPEMRLLELQVGNPYTLKILGHIEGTCRHEYWLHHEFAKSRLQGEWFSRTPELMKRIEELTGTGQERGLGLAE
jgi:hypothetical protein